VAAAKTRARSHSITSQWGIARPQVKKEVPAAVRP